VLDTLVPQPIAVPIVRSRSLQKRLRRILDKRNKQLLKLLKEKANTLIITEEKLLEKGLIFEENFMVMVNNNRSR